MADIYEIDKRIEIQLKLARNEMKREDYEVLMKFINYLLSKGFSKHRIEKYIKLLRRIYKMNGKAFDGLNNREKVYELLAKIELLDVSYWTKRDYRVVLKRFIEFLYPDAKDIVAEIKTCGTKASRYKAARILPEELLTEEEVKKMAEAASNIRDKAFVLALYESGARIGEFLNMKIKDIKFDEYGAIVILKSKTGMRRVRLVMSAPALAEWLANHPFRDDPEAYVWVGLTRRDKSKPLSHRMAMKILKELAKKAGIKKRVYPHLFRHSRATHLAKVLPEQVLKVYMGWEPDSKMAAIYVHLSGKDIDKYILESYGIKVEEKKEQELKPRKCPRCGHVNDPTAKFCSRCGLPLTIEAVIEIEEKRKLADEIMNLLFQDEEFVKFVEKKLKELKDKITHPS